MSTSSEKKRAWDLDNLSPWLMSNRLHESCLPGGISPAALCAHPFPPRRLEVAEAVAAGPHPYFSVARFKAANAPKSIGPPFKSSESSKVRLFTIIISSVVIKACSNSGPPPLLLAAAASTSKLLSTCSSWTLTFRGVTTMIT